MDKDNENAELDGADIFSNWDQLVQSDQPATHPNASDDTLSLALDNLALDGGETHWLSLFQKTNLSDMDLVALSLVRSFEHDFKAEAQQFKSQAQLFMAELSTAHKDELRVAGLSEDQIIDLAQGKLPINWTLHLKYPLAYGGALVAHNLVLIPQHPFHEDLHHFVNQQMVTDAGVISPAVLYVPVPKSAVYVPYGSAEMAKEVIHFQQGGLK